MKKLELLNLLGNLLIENFEKEIELKGKKLQNREIYRLQLMNCYSKAGKESLVYNCRNYAKKLNKLNLMPVFVQTAYKK
jgi:hypothetical protein